MSYNLRVALLIFFAILQGAWVLRAQTLKGTVVDGATGKPLYLVSIFDITTTQSATTDDLGKFVISVKSGDIISYSFIGYQPIQRIASPGMDERIELLPLSVQLKEYILHPDYTPFQKDSAEIATLYSKELNLQPIKPKVDANNGLEVNGLIGSAVQKMSRSYKRSKKFKATFKQDEEQKFIDTRYRPELVNAITGFAGDTLAMFMNYYPMEYAFARAASDLEIRMWIRDNYKDYLHRKTE